MNQDSKENNLVNSIRDGANPTNLNKVGKEYGSKIGGALGHFAVLVVIVFVTGALLFALRFMVNQFNALKELFK